jgi:hypothetical protein
MTKNQIRSKMDSLMKEAKAKNKEAQAVLKGLKKKDRDKDEYKQKVSKGSDLMKEISALLAEFQKLSKELYKRS